MWSNVNWNQRYMWGSDSNKISWVTSDAVKKKYKKKKQKKNTKKKYKKKMQKKNFLRTDGTSQKFILLFFFDIYINKHKININ